MAGAAAGAGSGTLVVGLTGGIAAGKTTVARRLAAAGADWIDADAIAREVVEPGTAGLQDVVAAFGPQLLDDRGRLRRQALGAIVFADPSALRRLESLLHPRIRAEIRRRVAAAHAARTPVALIDAALLVEMGLADEVDVVVAVFAPRQARIARVAARDGLPAEHAERRIAAQAPDEVLRARADRAIDNDGTPAKLDADVDRLWAELSAWPRPVGTEG